MRSIRGPALKLALVVMTILAFIRPGGSEELQQPSLEVVETRPPGGATGVPVTTSVTASFNQAVDVQTISGTIFTLDSVPGTVTYDHESSTVVFSPAEQLARSTTYTARLSGMVRTRTGSDLGGDYTWSFTTEANTTSIGNGRYTADGRTEPGNRNVGADMTAFLDAFDLSTLEGPTDTIKSVTVKPLPEGISADIAKVEIVSPSGEVKGTLENPSKEPWVIPVEGLKADKSQWLVRIRTRKDLQSQPYKLTGTVVDAESERGNMIVSADTTSATLAIDGRPPIPQTMTGTITFPAIFATSITVQVTFDGDSPPPLSNNTCVLRWGTAPGKFQNSAMAVRNGNVFTSVLKGLTRNTTYFLEATFSDPDGVKGPNPLRESVKTAP